MLGRTPGRHLSVGLGDGPNPQPVTGGSVGVPIFLLNDTKLADNNNDLWDGSIDTTLSINENGDSVGSGDVRVWTGTNSTGTGYTSANQDRNLGSTGGATYYGVSQTNGQWMRVGDSLSWQLLQIIRDERDSDRPGTGLVHARVHWSGRVNGNSPRPKANEGQRIVATPSSVLPDSYATMKGSVTAPQLTNHEATALSMAFSFLGRIETARWPDPSV
jgi:hypothetical protein